ncbi:MAG: helix-turn-helix transcriptional regulator [Candidatus Acidiferrum sp.]
MVRSGERLKELRTNLGITTREVTERSQKIAEAEANQEFYISNAWLTQIENTHATPSIYKLYSISAIYHVKFTDLLLLFGVNLQTIGRHQLALIPQHTQLTSVDSAESDQAITLPLRFDRAFDENKTNLLSRMIQAWGVIPVSLVQHLDVKHAHYGYVGLQDYTLYPLVRPGSFVQIEQKLRKVRASKWRSEFERPIYFVELRDGYACSWCELQGNKLLLVPHPLSPCSIRQFIHGEDAEIVGQVTGVAMRLIAAKSDSADQIPDSTGKP